MKRFAVASLGALVCASRLATAEMRADAPDGDATDVVRLSLRDQVMVDHPGATAAFSVDPTVADVSARDGRVTIIARGVGTTTISIVTPTAIVSQLLTVVAPAPWLRADAAETSSRSWTLLQGAFESSTARLTNSVDMVDGTDQRTLRAYAVNVLRLDAMSASDADARTSLPALALEWRTADREIVLFDKTIEHSQLTLDGTPVRGAHVRLHGLELHAGVTSPVLYQNVFLSRQAETVFGASYAITLGRSSLTPSAYAFPSTPTTGGTDGAVTSLLYKYRSKDDRLQLRSELGWGGRFGAAGELNYQDPVNRAWLSVRHQPRGFAALGIGRPLGSMLDATYTAQPSKRLTVLATTSAARYQASAVDQDVVTAMVDSRARVAGPLSLSLGMSSGRFSGVGMADSVQSLTVPAGLYLENARGGIAALYRYQSNTARNLGGHGGRLSARVHGGGLHASAFVDAQQEAATVGLVLREEPVLAQLLSEMGLTASSPDELARLLRENATLAQLGYTQGVHLDWSPWRTQAGADLAWLPGDEARQQLRLRVLASRTQTVNDLDDTVTASLSYARRLGRNVEATTMMSWWSTGDVMSSHDDSWSIAAGLRVRVDRVPRLRSAGSRQLAGVVVTDRDEPVAGVTIRLDGGRAAITDGAGRFSFSQVARGDHRVDAQLPAGAYFASPSSVTASAGDPVRFVVARAPARLHGTIRDDAGGGIAGIVVELRGAAGTRTATTDAFGRFQLAAAPGTYILAPSVDSVPVGYDPVSLTAREVELDPAAPVSAELIVRANRSIAGVVHCGRTATVRLVELDRTGAVDSAGRYAFRGVPAGRHTLEATCGTREGRRVVELPAAPTVLANVELL